MAVEGYVCLYVKLSFQTWFTQISNTSSARRRVGSAESRTSQIVAWAFAERFCQASPADFPWPVFKRRSSEGGALFGGVQCSSARGHCVNPISSSFYAGLVDAFEVMSDDLVEEIFAWPLAGSLGLGLLEALAWQIQILVAVTTHLPKVTHFCGFNNP